jgi:hypothetical protein
MFRIEPVGFRETRRKLNRLIRGMDSVGQSTIKRLVVAIVEEAKIDLSYVRFVEVRGSGETYFGFSIDPDPKVMRLEELLGFLVFVFIADPEDKDMIKLASGSPWSVDMMPMVPSQAQGFLLYRDAMPDEIVEVRSRNRDYLRSPGRSLVGDQPTRTLIQRMSDFSSGLELVDMNEKVLADDDLRYNQARAEFGIGRSPSPVLRQAIRRSIEKRILGSFEEVAIDIAEGRDPDRGLPRFDRVPGSWLKENEAFMGLIVPDII